METLRNVAPPLVQKRRTMYRLYIHDLHARLLHREDGELAVLLRQFTAAGYQVPGYKKVWQRVKQSGGAYADYIHHNDNQDLYLLRVVKLSLLSTPEP